MTEPEQPGPPPGREQPRYETYGGESFFAPPGETQQLPVGPPPPDPRRRRTLWIVGGLVAFVLVAGGVAAIVATSGPSSAASSPTASASPSPGNTPPAKGHGKGAKHRKGDAGGVLAGGASALQGTVTSVAPGKLTITPSGMPPITVNTSDSTKVSGPDAGSLSDVGAGQQVVVVVRNGTATAIRIRQTG